MLRALAAIVAEKGYPATTVAEIVDRASTSQRTFYEHFANKEDAIIAALDSGSAQMLGTVLPAFRRAQDWRTAVRGAYEAMFAFGVEEPEYSRLGAVEMYAAGKRALQTRDTIMEGLEALLAPGYELEPRRRTDRRRGDRRRDLRAGLRPGQGEGAGKPAGTGPDGDLHDAGAVPRGRGSLRPGDRRREEIGSAEARRPDGSPTRSVASAHFERRGKTARALPLRPG